MNAQNKQKSHFDVRAKQRTLEPDDLVLLLLPTDNNKLLRSVSVLERIGINDYRIQIADNTKIFHINMLKKCNKRAQADIAATVAVLDHMSDDDDDDDDDLESVDIPHLTDINSQVNIGNNLSHEQKAEMIALSQEFEDICSDFPGYTNLLEHAIKLTTDKPVTIRQYLIPFAKLAEFDREVKAMLDANVIEYSSSPYRSPMLLVKKSDGTNRPVIDYIMLNRQTVFDAEPIPNVDAIFAKLGSANFVSKLDFTKGYWQIPMMHSDKEKTALMQFRVMPCGLVNAGATYTRMMRHLLQDLPNVDNYIDDVLVYTDSWQEHIASIRALFYRIRDAKLTIKSAKCYLGYYSVSFLGHVIKHGNLHTRQETIDKIVKCPVPKTIKQVRAFLGLSGYYRYFFPKYAEVASPLVDLTKKGQPNVVVWNQ